MNSQQPDNLPLWARIVRDIGFPAAIAFWLLYWLPQMDRRLTEIVLLLQQHLAQR